LGYARQAVLARAFFQLLAEHSPATLLAHFVGDALTHFIHFR
jgi:hypothetical protein